MKKNNNSDFGERYLRSISSRVEHQTPPNTPMPKTPRGCLALLVWHSLKISIPLALILFVVILFEDFIFEVQGKKEANPLTVLSITNPPHVGEMLNEFDVEKLPHYKSLYNTDRYVTLYKDDSYGYLFLINSSSNFESHRDKEDSVLLGYDEEKKRVYGFQLNIADQRVTKQMSLEKAVILSARYLPTHIINGVRSETYYYDAPWGKVHCLETKSGFNLVIAKFTEGNWIVYGGPEHSNCHPVKGFEKWNMNFDELFARTSENLFLNH